MSLNNLRNRHPGTSVPGCFLLHSRKLSNCSLAGSARGHLEPEWPAGIANGSARFVPAVQIEIYRSGAAAPKALLLRCPKKSSGLRFSSIFSTAATRSPRFFCRWQRSARSPLEEKLSPKVTDEVCSKTLRTCTTPRRIRPTSRLLVGEAFRLPRGKTSRIPIGFRRIRNISRRVCRGDH